MVELVTALEQAHRESPSWRLYGLCHQAATRIAELEAEVERLTKNLYLTRNERDNLSDNVTRLESEALSRTGAVKVPAEASKEMIEDGVLAYVDAMIKHHQAVTEVITHAMSDYASAATGTSWNKACFAFEADAILCALSRAGFRILGPDEVDPQTVEKCAEIALRYVNQTDYDLEPEASVAENVTAKMIAAAIRAIGRKA